jgi:hypothetical protein
VIRAANQAGATEVIVPVGEQSVIVRLTSSTDPDKVLATSEEIIL